MKLKKSASPEATASAAAPTGGAVIADRFKLDPVGDSSSVPGVGRTAAMIALIAALVTTALIGAVAALMYVNWDLIKDV